jgi:DNA processing protein
MKDFKHIYYLMRTDRLGPVRVKNLIDEFGSAEKVFSADLGQLISVEGIEEGLARAILKQRRNLSSNEDYERLLHRMERFQVNVITYEDENYPQLLKTIYDPPIILYFRGTSSVEKESYMKNCVAIVGTRRPTDYGRHIAEKFANELSSAGLCVVSGFARGIDTIAHKTVLESGNGGFTAAVFGNGIDVVYPPENRRLYERMASEGLLLSEYELGTGPDAVNFPRRNRIISGLSLGVLVIESGKDGGALITARCALDQSREVFAIPGYITSKYSAGTNSLIKNGLAKLVENTDDILDEFSSKISIEKAGKKTGAESPLMYLKESEKLIVELIYNSSEAIDIDTISEQTGLNISDCLVNLLNLEFKNLVKQLPGKRFMRTK